MKILVVGGAGYIGAHVVRALLERGNEVHVIDDLSAGDVRSIPDAQFRRNRWQTAVVAVEYEGVVLLAGRVLTGESFDDPLGYYDANVAGLIACLDQLVGRTQRIVFASSCAASNPLSPYAASKAMGESILSDAAARHGFSICVLRFFNVVGGQNEVWLPKRPASHLLRVLARVALGMEPAVTVNGVDYDTPDGTCVRDYLHVRDVAQSVCAAVEGDHSGTHDVGAGRGVSVLEAIRAMQETGNTHIPVQIGPRRPGDPPSLIASGKQPWRGDIRELCASELETEARRGL